MQHHLLVVLLVQVALEAEVLVLKETELMVLTEPVAAQRPQHSSTLFAARGDGCHHARPVHADSHSVVYDVFAGCDAHGCGGGSTP